MKKPVLNNAAIKKVLKKVIIDITDDAPKGCVCGPCKAIKKLNKLVEKL